MVVICDPELANQVLDRSRTPHQIDKPHESMFYHVVDEVICPLQLSVCLPCSMTQQLHLEAFWLR